MLRGFNRQKKRRDEICDAVVLGDRPALPDDVVLVYLVDVDDRRSDSKLVARGDFPLSR
ncbi:putative lipoprotein YbaY [Nitrobacteraceae bacterium AZCC 2299]